MKKISTAPPARVPLVQTRTERLANLNKWERLLENVPNCKLEKSHRGLIEQGASFLTDNPELFYNSIFVLSSEANLQHHPEACCTIFFLFRNNEEFSTLTDGNSPEECGGANDVLVFSRHDHEERADWVSGYNQMINILEEAFPVNQIPAPPAF